MQYVSTVGATAATFLSVNGRDIVVVSNSGGSGNRELNSTVYEFTDSGQLEEVMPALHRKPHMFMNVPVCMLCFTDPECCYSGCQ